MSYQPPPPSVVERARQLFFVEGADPGADLAPYIRRSWRRCSALPQVLSPAEPVTGIELSQRREAAEWLRRCAQPELDGLAEHALQQGCVVILSDAAGLILDEVGCPDFLPKAQRVALTPGVDWSETRRGTNAIGTVLMEREALMVRGGEHFLAQNSVLGCAAAPVFDARGELLGVLDISGESVRVDVHALGLVRLAAAQLEHRLMSSRNDGPLLRFHLRPGLLDTPREGLLSVRDGVIVGANRTALGLLGMDWGQAIGASADSIFGDRWQSLHDGPGLVASADGRHWAVALSPHRHATPQPQPQRASASTPALQQETVDPQLARAARVSAQGIPIVVTGETGSGKEVFVRRLHQAGRRAAGPLVSVNCAALPETLIEAELFGYEDGAFTGARRRGMPGRLRQANGGMLFLDEIGDMPLPLQTRLLRVLEDRLVRPLGGQRDLPVDFDLVCATHRDLRSMVRQGSFREDLLYRLQGYTVALAPLRDRPDRRQLIRRLFDDCGGPARGLRLSDAALHSLENRPWPGNVRELLSVLRSLVALAEDDSTLTLADVQPCEGMSATPPAAAPRPAPQGLLASLTEAAVQQALQASQGNVSGAARQLGLHRSTLYRHLAQARAGFVPRQK